MESSSEKVFFRSVKILQNYGRESVAHFFGPPCISITMQHIRVVVFDSRSRYSFFSFFSQLIAELKGKKQTR